MSTSNANKSLKEWIAEAEIDNAYSEDISWIQGTYDFLPLFVYGPEKRGFSDNEILEKCLLIGHGFTGASAFVLWLCRTFPVAMYDPQDSKAAKLQGEVYLVPPRKLFELDSIHSNGILSNKMAVTVDYYKTHERNAENPKWYKCLAYMYVGEPKNLSDQLAFGRKADRYTSTKSNNELYYVLSMNDDKIMNGLPYGAVT